MFKNKKYYCVFIILTCCFGCQKDKSVILKNGYIYAETNKQNNFIIKNKASVVDTYIQSYKIYNDYVLGFRTPSKRLFINEKDISKKYGYFILNLNTDELVEGYYDQEFIKQTTSIGIPKKIIDQLIKS